MMITSAVNISRLHQNERRRKETHLQQRIAEMFLTVMPKPNLGLKMLSPRLIPILLHMLACLPRLTRVPRLHDVQPSSVCTKVAFTRDESALLVGEETADGRVCGGGVFACCGRGRTTGDELGGRTGVVAESAAMGDALARWEDEFEGSIAVGELVVVVEVGVVFIFIRVLF